MRLTPRGRAPTSFAANLPSAAIGDLTIEKNKKKLAEIVQHVADSRCRAWWCRRATCDMLAHLSCCVAALAAHPLAPFITERRTPDVTAFISARLPWAGAACGPCRTPLGRCQPRLTCPRNRTVRRGYISRGKWDARALAQSYFQVRLALLFLQG